MINASKTSALLLAAGLCAGCAAPHDPYANEFGTSVRQMIEAQTYDPGAALNPPPEPPTQMDGRYGSAYLEVYRSDAADPKTIKKGMKVVADD